MLDSITNRGWGGVLWLGLHLLAVNSLDAGEYTDGELAPSFRNARQAARVIAGEVTVANAAWWGFSSQDATDAIQAAVYSGARRVVIPYVGRPWVIRPIKLVSDQEIVFEPGVVLLAKAGAYRGMRDSLLQAIEIENVTLYGYGATLRMRKEDYTGPRYAKSEFRHVLDCRGCRNVNVLGLTLMNSGGDGIYLGPTHDERRVPCRDITIRDVVSADNYRQGISVVSAADVMIDKAVLRNTVGTAPQAGIDLEPSHPRDLLENIVVKDTRALDNAGTGFMVNISRLNASSRPISIIFENSLVMGSRQPGIRTILRSEEAVRGQVDFRDCVIQGTQYSGLYAIWPAHVPIALRFANCKWAAVARRSGEYPLHLELIDQREPGRPEGGIEFVNSYVYDAKARSPIRVVRTGKYEGPLRVTGEIHVVNSALKRSESEKVDGVKELKINYHSE